MKWLTLKFLCVDSLAVEWLVSIQSVGVRLPLDAKMPFFCLKTTFLASLLLKLRFTPISSYLQVNWRTFGQDFHFLLTQAWHNFNPDWHITRLFVVWGGWLKWNLPKEVPAHLHHHPPPSSSFACLCSFSIFHFPFLHLPIRTLTFLFLSLSPSPWSTMFYSDAILSKKVSPASLSLILTLCVGSIG